MKNQHRGLLQVAGVIINLPKNIQRESGKINSALFFFKSSLDYHLDLENSKFYKQLIKKKSKNGVDMVPITDFILKIRGIENQAYIFSEKYKTEASIIIRNICRSYPHLN